jgi:hypothetical protein
MTDEYTEAGLQRLLAEHPHIAEQGIQVARREHAVVLTGEVESDRRRAEICRLVAENFPDIEVHCDIGVIRNHVPVDHEEL